MRAVFYKIVAFFAELRLKKYIFYSIPFLILLIYVLLELSSRSAALLFNRAMEEQEMLRGTITVERLSADITGEVRFQELLWTTPEGAPILRIPSGSFHVDLLDALTHHFRSTSIRKLELQNASISLYLDENMKLDVIQNTHGLQQMEQMEKKTEAAEALPFSAMDAEERKRRGEEKRKKFQSELADRIQNFHYEGKDFKLNLALEQCRVEVLHKNHHYIISGINFKADIDTQKEIAFRIRTGPFGGTMIGRGMIMYGNVRMDKEPVPECNVAIMLRDVDPSSMGLGTDVHDKMTLYTYFDGPVTAPIGTGNVAMEELHIPGLDFTNVKGDLRYKDSKLEFLDVTSEVYGGKFNAVGIYDFDTRYYRLEGVGEDLMTKKALPGAKLSCKVHLELSMESKGSAKETYIRGTFRSGSGFYQTWIPFDEISGRFSNAYQDLRFYDVKIGIGGYQVSTDAFSIIDKKLTLDPIYLIDEHGKLIMGYDPETKKTYSAEGD